MPDAESQRIEHDDELTEPEVIGVLRFEFSGLALGPDYPATTISAEIGRVAIAAARVDQEYALLLSGLHAGERAHWDFGDLRRRSAWLRDKSLARVKELFEGQLFEHAHAVVQTAYAAVDHRHAAMHGVWTLTGPDAITPAVDLIAALESSNPDAALAELVGCDVDSEGWSIVHPRTGGPGPAPVAELRGIRRELEQARESLTELRFRLASALYAGKPPGARRVVHPDTGERLANQRGPVAAGTATATFPRPISRRTRQGGPGPRRDPVAAQVEPLNGLGHVTARTRAVRPSEGVRTPLQLSGLRQAAVRRSSV